MADYRTVKESILKSTTLYRVETKSNLLNLYEHNKVYSVERRFNDFKQLHESLSSNPNYQGFALPPLPVDNSYT